jgi:hypothetical protein
MRVVWNFIINGTLNTDIGEACNIKEWKYDWNIVFKFENFGQTKTITF